MNLTRFITQEVVLEHVHVGHTRKCKNARTEVQLPTAEGFSRHNIGLSVSKTFPCCKREPISKD